MLPGSYSQQQLFLNRAGNNSLFHTVHSREIHVQPYTSTAAKVRHCPSNNNHLTQPEILHTALHSSCEELDLHKVNLHISNSFHITAGSRGASMAGQQKSLRQPHADQVLQAQKAQHLCQPGAHTKCNWDSVGGGKKKEKKTKKPASKILPESIRKHPPSG